MLGSFLSRTLILVFGYAYPAYECFKIVEITNNNKSEINQLVTWCQFWILIAMLTVVERVGDIFCSWLPFYSEIKLGFLIYLWSSKMKGTKYIYSCFFQPFMAQHEEEIDKNILEFRRKAGNFAITYWRKVLIFCQIKFLKIMQSVSSTESAISRPSHRQKTCFGQVNAKESCEPKLESNEEEEEEKEKEESISNCLEENQHKTSHGNWRGLFSSSTITSD